MSVDPTIVTNFSSPASISAVTFGFNRNSGAGIFLPSTVQIGGETFALTGNEFADGTRADLTFTLAQPIFGSQLTLSLSRNDAVELRCSTGDRSVAPPTDRRHSCRRWRSPKGTTVPPRGRHPTASLRLIDGTSARWIFVDELKFFTAVPEPSVLGFLLAGVGALWVCRHRRVRL
ncbi:MAG: PEP-CTERM sorting domain-containing protein [Opitutus sp.]|nr:PEP-CTERM sorting domain-containing protein [Opitutus sp.]